MDLKKHISKIEKNGFTVIKSVLKPKDVEDYKKILKLKSNYSDQNSKKVKKFHNGAEVIYNLQNKDILFYNLISHKIVMKIGNILLKKGSYLNEEPFILCQSTARNPGPFAKQQQLHIDSNLPGLPYCFYMQVMWILDDFNQTSGGTRFVPGSHKFKRFAKNEFKYSNEVYPDAPKGSVIIFDGGVWHGGGESKINSERWMIINTYCRWFLKQTFDMPRGLPNSIFKKLDDCQKELLGFKCVPAKNEFERKTRISEDFFNPFK